MDAILHHLRRLVAVEDSRDEPDRELLQRFIDSRDEAAFCALVERHGPTVMAVCRRVLRNEQDAEDALQATFLVLVRNARSVRRGDSVGSWLYGVARRIASKARDRIARQRACDKAAENALRPSVEPTWSDVQEALDQELQELPDKYRAPILLCCLRGMSRCEAARELGWKEGAVKIRLERARELLRARLLRRGIVLSTAFAGLMVGGKASAAVPSRLVAGLVHAAVRHAAGESLTVLVSPSIVILTQEAVGGLKVLRVVALTLLMLCGFGATLVALASDTSEEFPVALAQADPEPFAPAVAVTPEQPQSKLVQKHGATLAGGVHSVDANAPSLTLAVGDTKRTFFVRPGASVLIDKKPARLSDLRPYSRIRVTLTADGQEVDAVEANGPVVRGTLVAVDAERGKLTVASRRTQRTFLLRKDAEIVVAGKQQEVLDLSPGLAVILHLSVSQKLVLKVEAQAK